MILQNLVWDHSGAAVMGAEEETFDELPPLDVVPVKPFSWQLFFSLFFAALGAVFLVLRLVKARDDFKFDTLGADQYKYSLHPRSEHFQTVKEMEFDTDEARKHALVG
jgi:hypothetical protein